jgi:hypothetical protein
MVDSDLSPEEQTLLDDALTQALADSPRGVKKARCDRLLKGESREHLENLIRRGLLAEVAGGTFFTTLRAMAGRREDFKESLAPLDGVIAEGRRILSDDSIEQKLASFDHVIRELEHPFPTLASKAVLLRFQWALYGLAPFVWVAQSTPPRTPVILTFSPNLLGVASLDDVLRLQDESRRRDEESYRTTAISMSAGNVPALSAASSDSGLPDLLARLASKGTLTLGFESLLRRDADEVVICLANGAYKAVLILCGGILEGVLVALLSRNDDVAKREFGLLARHQHKDFPDDASLPDLVELARKELRQGLDPLLGEVHESLATLINGHRDLVHPHAEVRAELLPVDEYSARAVEANLCVLLAGIARKLEGGWLKRYRSS